MQYTYSEHYGTISDLYKDAFGFRPDIGFAVRWQTSTADERQAIWDNLLRELNDSMAAEEKAQAAAAIEVEKSIAATLGMVKGSTRTDAIRYLHDAHNTGGDEGYLEHCLGLKYGYFRETAQ